MAIVLDLITPLVVPQLDVRGNASHWVIRTADAAINTTFPNWLAAFDSQDQWESLDVAPAALGFAPYVASSFRSKRGLGRDTIRARHHRRFHDAWSKALVNWNHTFRDQAEHFYVQLLDNEQDYAKATRLFLGLVGLNLENWLGAFSVHIMALCGNLDILDQPGGHTNFRMLSFPAPPIVPPAFRKALDHGLMGLLCRDVYFALFLGGNAFPNAQLDTVLTGSLGFAYTGFMHIETDPQSPGGGYFLHTVIEGAPDHIAPIALDFALPMPTFTGTGITSLVVGDLYSYVTPGDLTLASGFIRLDTIQGNVSEASLLLR